ncbi:thiamine kinase [Klebsiella michiganensis]|uniref:thiamine kinase n=1 Tax=Klebsiella michiganensis TaxID=1134687 RepID=UPI000651AF60|nr:thiamine kinase [Klebsiella michiganensis]KMK42889.1 thiamine kinase [Klebsiella michiganensis]MCW9486294.1 thiamine kinase [Klebsiella michiganensis]NNS04232.1 thiamine kinase [Klebsiella michiganensis]SBL96266.1 thiamine kinase [Klebsiella michiganensis]
MLFSNNKLTRDELLSRFFPRYTPVAAPPQNGLSGGSCILSDGRQKRVLRQPHDPHAPACDFRRQYHVLSRLPDSLAPAPVFYSPAWMVVEYCSGDVVNALPECPALAGLLYHLHQQPRFGWRIALRPLLERYWQQCSPARRTPQWLRWHKRLLRRGEPRPLRLAPLHMDVHAGNIVHGEAGLRLIDWEYAGDGDVALELAAVWIEPAAHRRLAAEYARRASIDEPQLWRQIQRWRPWVQLLMAGWYERRWQQTGDRQFIALADEVWRQLDKK